MGDELLVNVAPSETRVALIENGAVQELFIERSSRRGLLGNIYKGRVSRVVPGIQAAFVDIGFERAAFLHRSDVRVGGTSTGAPEQPIETLLAAGDEILVQVVKEPIGRKGARLTMNLSVASRFLVLMPFTLQAGISARIEDEAERERLREVVEALREEGQLGCIVRTNGEAVDQFALRADWAFLRKLWDVVCRRSDETEAGERVYEDLDLALRAVRDLMRSSVERVRVDDEVTFVRMREFAEQFMPEWVPRLEWFREARPLFDLFGVDDEINSALRRRVPLKSGGHLVIDQTEAMTTIDVNTGSFLGRSSFDETVFKTNLEAAQAIGRQLRLRNLGGIIIIDFIDMQNEEQRAQLQRVFSQTLARDSAKTKVAEISDFGLIEMTRKRTSDSLEHVLCEPCAACEGRGYRKSSETVASEIFREIARAVRQFNAGDIMVLAAPGVVDRILEEESVAVAELEASLDRSVRFQPEDQYGQEQFDVVLI